MKLIRHEKRDACTSQLCNMRAVVRESCMELGFEQKEINNITLAIDEASTNIIRYAYKGKPGKIILEIYQHDGNAIFRLQDFAKCIDESCLKLRKKNLLKPGGLGLDLIHQIMDSVELIPPTDTVGNILELTKHIP